MDTGEMVLFVVIVIGVCYLMRFLLADRREPSKRPAAPTLRTSRGGLVGTASRSDPAEIVEGESLRWTALDDHQLRRLLEQPSP